MKQARSLLLIVIFFLRAVAAPAMEADILETAEGRPLGILVDGKPAKYGDPQLADAVDALSDISRPWTVPKIIGLFKRDTSEWLRKFEKAKAEKADRMWKGSEQEAKRCGQLATILAASRDRRAAVVLGEAMDNVPEFPGLEKVMIGLYDYFLPDPRYQRLPRISRSHWLGLISRQKWTAS